MDLTMFEVAYLVVAFVLLVLAGTLKEGGSKGDEQLVLWAVLAILWPVATPVIGATWMGVILGDWWRHHRGKR